MPTQLSPGGRAGRSAAAATVTRLAGRPGLVTLLSGRLPAALPSSPWHGHALGLVWFSSAHKSRKEFCRNRVLNHIYL